MANAIEYCERCRKLIHPANVKSGNALSNDSVALCIDCTRALPEDEYAKLKKKSPQGAAGKTGRAAPPRRNANQRRDADKRRAEATGTVGGLTPTALLAIVMTSSALIGSALVFVLYPTETMQPARPPAPPTTIAAPQLNQPQASPPAVARDVSADAAGELAAIASMHTPDLSQYAEMRRRLSKFRESFAGTPEVAKAETLLGEIDSAYAGLAEEALGLTINAARVQMKDGEFDGAERTIRSIESRFGDGPWFETKGRAGVASALAEIAKTRIARSESAATSRRAVDMNVAPELTLDLGAGGNTAIELVYVRPGTFVMGGDGKPERSTHGVQKPRHEVAITKGFFLGKYEVTQAQYEAVMGSNPSEFKGADRPVANVAFADVTEFCKRASAKTGRKVRLPTEAEWEYACRAGTTTDYSFGSDDGALGEYAWYRSNGGRKTHPVGQKKPNPWGLFDMHGNAHEFIADWYSDKYYASSPREDPAGPSRGKRHVVRGGGTESYTQFCTSSFRRHRPVSATHNSYGFRVAVSADADDTVD